MWHFPFMYQLYVLNISKLNIVTSLEHMKMDSVFEINIDIQTLQTRLANN